MFPALTIFVKNRIYWLIKESFTEKVFCKIMFSLKIFYNFV